MDHRIEQRLQVDAFRQTIGGDEDAVGVIDHRINPFAAFLGRQSSGHNLDRVRFELGPERLSDGFCGGNEAAEDDGARVLLAGDILHLHQEFAELWIIGKAGSKAFGLRDELTQLGGLLGVCGGGGFHVRIGEFIIVIIEQCRRKQNSLRPNSRRPISSILAILNQLA